MLKVRTAPPARNLARRPPTSPKISQNATPATTAASGARPGQPSAIRGSTSLVAATAMNTTVATATWRQAHSIS
ncbi:MAG: hypothetical protein FIA92_11145 [Chloroflexi bacterium]|nr:hypothetical protein [Chloroflexota bacterium]